MAEPSIAQRKFHLSLNVSNLERSVDFYRTLFGQEPARHEVDYAKFEVTDPPVVLALEPRATEGTGALNHVGVRVSGAEEVQAMQDRLVAGGLETQFIQNIECCYSRQTKIVTWDPDRTLWEIYVLEEDSAREAAPAPAPAFPSSNGEAKKVCSHTLGETFPALGADMALDEVRLRGTLNAVMDERAESEIFASILRALKPGGRLQLHGMVADRPVTKALPQMPGQAARVERVPIGTDVIHAIESAGFVGITCTRYSHSPVFRVGDVGMRELLVNAWKRGETSPDDEAPRAVVYKGPFRAITDDDGIVYPRGEHVFVAPRTFDALRQSSLAEHFVFVTTDASCAPDGCAPAA